jgi:hypothetical protein
MPIGRPNHQPQNHAASIGQHRSLDAQLATIGWVFPGFFPRPAVLCSSLRPAFATAKRCRDGGRTQRDLASTACGTRRTPSTVGSSDASCCPRLLAVVPPSTGNLSASRSQGRPRRVEHPAVVDLPWGYESSGGSTSANAAKSAPANGSRKSWSSWLGPLPG